MVTLKRVQKDVNAVTIKYRIFVKNSLNNMCFSDRMLGICQKE